MSTQIAPVGYTNGTIFKWNTRGQTIAAATVLPAVGMICVGLRLWSRIYKRTGFGLDDALMVPALLCVIGLGIALLFGISKNVIAHTTPPNPNAGSVGAQLNQISPPQVLVEKIEFVFLTILVPGYGFIKLSILFFYRRIFVTGTSSRFDVASKIAIGLTLAWTVAFTLLQIFECGKHIAYQWGPLNKQAYCVNGFKAGNALFISDTITDLIAIYLPIPIILQLQLTAERKIAIVGVFLLGAFPVIASIVRIVYTFQLQADGFDTPTDVDEGLTTVLYWCMLEAGISLIATNLPSIYFLVTKQYLRSLATSLRSTFSFGSLRTLISMDRSGVRSEYSNMETATSNAPNFRKKGGYEARVEDASTLALQDMSYTVDIRSYQRPSGAIPALIRHA